MNFAGHRKTIVGTYMLLMADRKSVTLTKNIPQICGSFFAGTVL